MRNNSYKSLNKSLNGFTFIEMMISITISLIVFLMIYRFMSTTKSHYMYGTVNLQNLHEARMAINYLRRDFSCISPYIPANVTFQESQKIQKQLFNTPSNTVGSITSLLQISPQQLLLYCFDYKSTDIKPQLTEVRYTFETSSKTLSRISKGKTIKFTGFSKIHFQTYVHQFNNKSPVLFVKFTIHEGKKIYGKDEIGSALELTTTIGSQFIGSSLANRAWRLQPEHKLN